MQSPQPPSAESNLQQRRTKMAVTSNAPRASPNSTTTPSSRGSPYLPTTRETFLLAIFPALLLFGTLFSVLSPQTRAAAAAASSLGSPDSEGTSHYPQSPAVAPSYFARKNNVVNIFFVKRGWFWITVTFFAFVATQPFFSSGYTSTKTLLSRRASAVVRWALVTGWWVLVTQWCFGPALIDRSFRLTGGGCEALQVLAEEAAAAAEAAGSSSKSVQLLSVAASSSACKHAGGRWSGGHDISGHVFLLTLGTTFLVQEMGWVLWRKARGGATGTGARTADARNGDARVIVMDDGAVKSAEVEADLGGGGGVGSGAVSVSVGVGADPALPAVLVTRFAAAVVGLSMWMLLMTAIYFHTWPEKLTGLLVALTGLYGVYVVPRFVPALRYVIGLPGL